MPRISRADLKRHEEACALLAKEGRLSPDEIHSILENWHEGAAHQNAKAAAHFTPVCLAHDFGIEIGGPKVLDLCAGTGVLSYMTSQHMAGWGEPTGEGFVLVEINEDYAAVARRILPDAEVIVGSALDRGLIGELATRGFDSVISNPPYGRMVACKGQAPRYSGSDFHYALIDIASDLADNGTFIIPQAACPFRYSGQQRHSIVLPGDGARAAYDRFHAETGIELRAGMGVDTSFSEKEWRDVSIRVEIALADFEEARASRLAADRTEAREAAPTEQADLFDIAA